VQAGYETEDIGKGGAADEERHRLSTTTTLAHAASRGAASSPVEFGPEAIRHKTCKPERKTHAAEYRHCVGLGASELVRLSLSALARKEELHPRSPSVATTVAAHRVGGEIHPHNKNGTVEIASRQETLLSNAR
jgi:hypothetical protein